VGPGPQAGELPMRKTEWRLVLDIDLVSLSDEAIDRILQTLKDISGDASLTLQSVEEGSVILKLKGSADGYKVIEHLSNNGSLSSVLAYRLNLSRSWTQVRQKSQMLQFLLRLFRTTNRVVFFARIPTAIVRLGRGWKITSRFLYETV
jgi:hypothetical protein